MEIGIVLIVMAFLIGFVGWRRNLEPPEKPAAEEAPERPRPRCIILDIVIGVIVARLIWIFIIVPNLVLTVTIG